MANATENKPIVSACGAGGNRNESSAGEYWTEERLASAKPGPMPKPGGGARPATTAEALPKGPPGSTPGHTPHGHGQENNPVPHLEPGTGGQAVHPVPHGQTYPYSTVGRFSYTRQGQEWFGSAALITPNIVLTAGHCVYDMNYGGQSFDWAFYPTFGWRAKTDPAYEFDCSYAAWWTAWSQNRNFAYDYGMLWIDADPGIVLKLIGWLGIAWGQSTNRTWNAVGYPGKPNPPFPGNIMYELVGQYAPSSTSGVIGLSNDTMEEGSSGGPWITKGPWSTNWPDTSPYHANGLQSYHLPASDTIEYSPYFTHEVHDLMKFLSDPANRK